VRGSDGDDNDIQDDREKVGESYVDRRAIP